MTVLLSVLLGVLTLALETFLGAAFGLDLWTPPLFTVFVLWLASSPIRTSDFIIVASLGLDPKARQERQRVAPEIDLVAEPSLLEALGQGGRAAREDDPLGPSPPERLNSY